MSETEKGFRLMEPAAPELLVPDYGLWPWFVAAAVAIVIGIIVMVVVRKRKVEANPQLARNVAYAEASAALAAVTAENARNSAVQASLILRKYLSTAAGDPALFETHEEFISRHDALKPLKTEARAATERGFTRLAALKYAPEIPAANPTEVVTESRALLETLHHGFAA